MSSWDEKFATRAGRMQASEIRELLKLLDQPDIISFAGGIPDPKLFPDKAFGDAYAELLASAGAGAALQYSVSEGYLPLRQWIAAHMADLGIACAPDNILITSGLAAGARLSRQAVPVAHDTALVCRPTYLGALQAFSAYEPRYDRLAPEGSNMTPAAYRDGREQAGGRVETRLSDAGILQSDRRDDRSRRARTAARSLRRARHSADRGCGLSGAAL